MRGPKSVLFLKDFKSKLIADTGALHCAKVA